MYLHLFFLFGGQTNSISRYDILENRQEGQECIFANSEYFIAAHFKYFFQLDNLLNWGGKNNKFEFLLVGLREGGKKEGGSHMGICVGENQRANSSHLALHFFDVRLLLM